MVGVILLPLFWSGRIIQLADSMLHRLSLYNTPHRGILRQIVA